MDSTRDQSQIDFQIYNNPINWQQQLVETQMRALTEIKGIAHQACDHFSQLLNKKIISIQCYLQVTEQFQDNIHKVIKSYFDPSSCSRIQLSYPTNPFQQPQPMEKISEADKEQDPFDRQKQPNRRKESLEKSAKNRRRKSQEKQIKRSQSAGGRQTANKTTKTETFLSKYQTTGKSKLQKKQRKYK